MALNFKNLAYFTGGLAIIAAPFVLVNSSHYIPRNEATEQGKNQAQSWNGAAAYYNMLKADPSTGLIDEAARSLAEAEALKRMNNFGSIYKTSALGLNWSELGPDDVGGRIRAIVFDKKNQGTIYAGGVAGGIFKSTNGGATWAPINDQLTNMIISCMSQDATGNYIYFGTGEAIAGAYTFKGAGLFKLELATNAITPLSSTSGYTFIKDVVCHKTDANTIFLGTDGNGFKISNDAGTTWHSAKLASNSSVVASAGNVYDVKLSTDGSYVFYASNKLYRSANADDFVADITPTVVANTNRSSVEIAISPSNPGTMYISGVTSGGSMGNVAQSVDYGATWVKLTSPIPDPFNPSGFSAQGNYDNVISVDPKNPYRIFLGGVAFWQWYGDNTGAGTWIQAAYQFTSPGSNQYVHSDLHALEWDPFNNNTLFVGGDGGITRTLNNGSSYITSNKGFNVTQAYALSYNRYPSLNTNGYPVGGAVCGNQDNGTTFVSGIYNGTKGALPVGGGDGNYCDFSHNNSTVLFSSVYYGQVNRAATIGYLNGDGFEDAEFANYGLKPGTPGFANFVTPIRLWETDHDQTSIDSVYFKAKAIDNLIGSTNGVKKSFSTKMIKSNNSSIFETLKLTLGAGATSTVAINYATPTSVSNGTIVIGTNTINVTRKHYATSVQAISTTVTATSILGTYVGTNDFDSLRIDFATAPANGSNLKANLTQKYLSGADVKVSTESTQNQVFGYNLLANLAAGDSVKVPDIMQSRLAVGINGAVYVVKRPLNFGITPDWVQVAGPKSRDESNVAAAFSGEVNTMEWAPGGDHLYVGTSSGNLYRISHLHGLKDSTDGSFVGPTSSPTFVTTYNGINRAGGNENLSTPIRCTRIGYFGGNVITSIAISPDTTNGGSIVVTVGNYNAVTSTSPKVYYAANPIGMSASSTTSNFTNKMGTGTTGLISNAPVYASLIEWKDNKRVLVGTEYGLYATSDIAATNPIWSKENNNKLPNVPVTTLRQQTHNSVACYNSGMIYAGTHGRGMWTCDTYYSPTVVGVNEITPKDKTTVSAIKLYPNPARENVNLSFHIDKVEALTLNIYDLKGMLVMTKYLGKLPEGDQLMEISTQDLISGNYIVSLNSSNAIIGTNRLVVVK